MRSQNRLKRLLPCTVLAAATLVPAIGIWAIAATSGPRIRFEKRSHDFGEMRSDQQAEYTWTFRNEGDEPLEIIRTMTSCGCTMTLLDEKTIPPGGTGNIKITFDASGQEGSVRKNLSVFSNDPRAANLLLTITASVTPVELPPGEEGAHPAIRGQSMLMGDCASCHSSPAEGRQGAELYAAVCAMCHGAQATGGLAPTLRDPSYLDTRSDEQLGQGIAFGTANPRMPGFSELMGGPLSEEQVESLVKLLRDWGPAREVSTGAPAGAPTGGG